jgi:tetratricopeptide (TPR) repeat protein
LGFITASCRPSGEKKLAPEQKEAVSGNTELEALDRNIISDSLNPENYYLRSEYYLGQKVINRALADISKAIQLNDKKSDYFVALADIYLAMNRVPNCLEALKKAETLDPVNNKALLKLARVYLIVKDYKTAFEYTKRALDLDRINPEAYFIRGYAYMEQGDTSLAIRNFQAAADQDQNYYDAFIELGSLYSSLKKPVATGYLETATRIDSSRAEGYYLLGLAYQEQENISKAVETYEKLLKIFPDFKEAHYNLGYINLVYINDFEKAKGYFTRAIALDPKYTDAYFNRGYSYELMGDYANARKDYQKALEIEPNYERSITGLNRLDSLQR